MNIYESAEDYLERILILSKKFDHVRSIDVVNDMGFSKPSISIAMKKLKESGYILVDEHGYLTLTDSGRKIAVKTYEKHKVLSDLFEKLGVPEDIAIKDACKIEHDLSDETFKAIKKYLSK